MIRQAVGMDLDKPMAADVWRERIEAQRDSGLSVRGWCKANGVHEHGFYCWRLKVGLSPARGRQRRGAARDGMRFTEVIVAPVATSPCGEPRVASIVEPIRLRLSRERELILPMSMSVEQVALLVRAIEDKPSTIEDKS